MDTTIAPEKPRPSFELSEIGDRFYWMARAVENLDGDALASGCYYCGVSFSWGQWFASAAEEGDFRCHSCGKVVHPHEHTQNPSEELLTELRSPGYFDRVWYHATLKENWIEAVQEAADGELLVHGGDRLTALGRADYLRYAHSKSYRSDERLRIYLHAFRIRETEGFGPAVLSDGKPESKELPEPLTIGDGFTGAAYYNRYEAPGTVSLIFGAKFIDGDSLSKEIIRDWGA